MKGEGEQAPRESWRREKVNKRISEDNAWGSSGSNNQANGFLR